MVESLDGGEPFRPDLNSTKQQKFHNGFREFNKRPRPICTATYCPNNPPTLARHIGRKCSGCANVRYP